MGRLEEDIEQFGINFEWLVIRGSTERRQMVSKGLSRTRPRLACRDFICGKERSRRAIRDVRNCYTDRGSQCTQRAEGARMTETAALVLNCFSLRLILWLPKSLEYTRGYSSRVMATAARYHLLLLLLQLLLLLILLLLLLLLYYSNNSYYYTVTAAIKYYYWWYYYYATTTTNMPDAHRDRGVEGDGRQNEPGSVALARG